MLQKILGSCHGVKILGANLTEQISWSNYHGGGFWSQGDRGDWRNKEVIYYVQEPCMFGARAGWSVAVAVADGVAGGGPR